MMVSRHFRFRHGSDIHVNARGTPPATELETIDLQTRPLTRRGGVTLVSETRFATMNC
jgi:hypothetical protein